MQTTSIDTEDSPLEVIPLINPGAVFDTFLLVFNDRTSEGEWLIVNIEAYSDPRHTNLIADDFRPADLGPHGERKFYAALNDAHEARLTLARLLRERATPPPENLKRPMLLRQAE
jgi:hypothetical protein